MNLRHLCIGLLTIPLIALPLAAQSDFNDAPIHYQTADTTDPVAKLAQRIAAGELELKWSDEHGWLPAILKTLDIPRSSQTLVFSKTSQQLRRIDPSRPRALYYSDDVYAGWVQNGDFVELAAVDPRLGAVFYTVDQRNSRRPIITRDRGQCLSCHATAKTQGVPGFLVRSVYPQKSGHPDFRLGTLPTDHTTPFVDRFGGWYVTGQHGSMRHRGNGLLTEDEANPIDREAGANLNELPKRVRAAAYLEPTSDLVALLLLEHQTQMHNFVTRAAFSARQALHYQQEMNRIFERRSDYQSESTTRRIESVSADLVKYLLFTDEFKLTSAVKGSSRFAEQFVAAGVRDRQGRSLRDLDLKTRLLRYPCSYLIYSDSFQSLPQPVLDRVKLRMLSILQGEDRSKEFSHLSDKDRRNILEILRETHPLFQTQAVDGPAKSLEASK